MKLVPQFVGCQSGVFERPWPKPLYILITSKRSRSRTHLLEILGVCIWRRWRIEILVFTGENFYDREKADRLTPWQLRFLLVKFRRATGCYLFSCRCFSMVRGPGYREMVIDKLRHEFWIGCEETIAFMYLGVNIQLLDETVFLSQKGFRGEDCPPWEISFGHTTCRLKIENAPFGR